MDDPDMSARYVAQELRRKLPPRVDAMATCQLSDATPTVDTQGQSSRPRISQADYMIRPILLLMPHSVGSILLPGGGA